MGQILKGSYIVGVSLRYAFGVIICSLALVTIILAILGVLMGMCGFRKNRDPDQRTKLSHCGGICLIL